jgi:hypothetical protein
MPKTHVVKEGECISSIALEYGHFAKTIWDDEANKQLKEDRGNGSVLLPGDELAIPDLRIPEETCALEQVHEFKLKGVPEKLELKLQAWGEPRANLDYRIDIDGTLEEGKTDADGLVSHFVPPGVKKVMLYIGDGTSEDSEVYELRTRHLDPPVSDSGVESRLRNLGYLDAAESQDGADEKTSEQILAEAIWAFQAASEGLDPTGEMDDDTRDKLVEAHGS